jgi:endonuclease III
MAGKDVQRTVQRLLDVAGRTYAQQAGIRLEDAPAPLFQLLVLASLLSARISAEIAVAAAKELFDAGLTTPAKMQQASWQKRVDLLGRARYKRYDESTSTGLGAAADLVVERWHGDLRRLAQEAGEDPATAAELLAEVQGIGPLGATIFLREAQAVWPWLRPFADDRVLDDARSLGLPHSPSGLAEAAGTTDLSTLTAAVVHISRDKDLRQQVEGDT